MSPRIITEVINKLNVFAYTAVTLEEKINGTLMIPMEKSDFMTLAVSLLTFSTMIPWRHYNIHIFKTMLKHIERSQDSIDCPRQ